MPKKTCRKHETNIKNGCQKTFKIDAKRDQISDVLPSGKKTSGRGRLGTRHRGAPRGLGIRLTCRMPDSYVVSPAAFLTVTWSHLQYS